MTHHKPKHAKDADQGSALWPAATLRKPSELAAAALIAPDKARALEAVAARYAIAVTPQIANLTGPFPQPSDPIARQYLPDPRELVVSPDERLDPIGDQAHSPVKGIVHRYPDRALLKPTHACAVYCRFCFRREMVGPGGEALSPAELTAALDYVRAHPEIREVILTGGDPLMLSPRRMADITTAIGGIAHVRILRLHSRVPVADSARVTGELLDAILAVQKPVYLALHANHARELETALATDCLAAIRRAGIQLLGQSVLLRGVNDSTEALSALFWRMIELGIKPYYLHHPDLAPGTAHFRLPVKEGQALMRALRGHLPGYALPTYVLDIPGGYGKVPIGPSYENIDSESVTDIHGQTHLYRD